VWYKAYSLLPYGFICLFGILLFEVFRVTKIRLFVRTRKNNKGSYIASVPLKQLVKLSGYDKTRWSYKDGWLILEAF
jgi:hypothetical protein